MRPLILVGASGFSYEEAAKICDCAIGTIKSRVNRARLRLAEILGIETVPDLAPETPEFPAAASGGRKD